MVLCGHAGKCCHAFSLASGRDDHDPVIRVIPQFIDRDQCVFRHIDITQFRCRLNDIDHRPAFQDHFSLIFISGIDDLLYPVHIRGECSNNDPLLLMLRKKGIKPFSDRCLTHGVARTHSICRITEYRQHTFLAQLCHSPKVHGIPVYRCIIHLEIAGMIDQSCRRTDRNCRCIRNTVIGPDKLHLEIAHIELLSVIHIFQFDTV